MPVAEVLTPADVAQDSLQQLYQQAGLETEIDGDGDLLVTDGISCYVLPTRQRDRLLLMAFVGTKGEIDSERKIEFANRVNNQISAVRGRVNDKGRLIFDHYVPIEGGITPGAVVSATQLFLQATAHAINNCDADNILR